MYTEHFGLTTLPFENVPDPVFFFDQGDHARIRQRITESLTAGRGLLVVTGPVGAGKTTLSQMIKSHFSSKLKLIWMAMPPDNRADLFMFIARELGLEPSSTETVFLINDIRDALLKLHSEGGKCMIIIDESHLIADDVLDSIRILNNLEEGPVKLMQILLLGQDELMEIIKRPELEPFRQRIANLETIGRMTTDRIKKYVSHRLQIAGGDDSIFSETGWEALCKAFTLGNTPRVINSFCDKSLQIAFEREKNAVDVDDIYEASQGMGLSSEVFHYKIELRRKKEEASSMKADDPVKDETPPETSESSQDISGNGQLRSKTEQKSLKIPLIILSLAIVTFILSIYSYCDISGSAEVTPCLNDLFFN
jgi:general secretion pathway protein A